MKVTFTHTSNSKKVNEETKCLVIIFYSFSISFGSNEMCICRNGNWILGKAINLCHFFKLRN